MYLAYVSRLTMPKLLITTGGDEFFLPDDSYNFWDSLRGEKHLRFKQMRVNATDFQHCVPHNRTLPNAEHSCAGHFTSLVLSLRTFYLSILLVSCDSTPIKIGYSITIALYLLEWFKTCYELGA